MEILPSRYYKSLKRSWRRRRNQETSGERSPAAAPSNKFFSKFHDAYADLMIYLTKKIPNPKTIDGGFLPHVVAAGGENISWVSSRYHREVDSKLVLVLEVYKNSASSQQIHE